MCPIKNRIGMLNSRELLAEIVEKLSDEPFMEGFKYLKSKRAFKLKTTDGWYMIDLFPSRVPSWQVVSTSDKEVMTDILSIEPIASRRFNLIMDWLYKLLVKHGIDRTNDCASAWCKAKEHGYDSDYLFGLDKCNFEQEYNRLRTCISGLARSITTEYITLEQLYKKTVYPFFKQDPDPYKNGFDWVFEDLYLSRLVDIDNYNNLKKIMMRHLDELKKRGEPNYIKAEHLIPEIIEALEREADIARKKLN